MLTRGPGPLRDGFGLSEALAEVVTMLGFADRIIVSDGAGGDELRAKDSVRADVCEALIGAIYLDSGFDAAKEFIKTHWTPLLDRKSKARKDAKTALQEWLQARSFSLPAYDVTGRDGPDHAPVFHVRVTADCPEEESADGKGRSKQEAEQAAAAAFLETKEGNN